MHYAYFQILPRFYKLKDTVYLNFWTLQLDGLDSLSVDHIPIPIHNFTMLTYLIHPMPLYLLYSIVHKYSAKILAFSYKYNKYFLEYCSLILLRTLSFPIFRFQISNFALRTFPVRPKLTPHFPNFPFISGKGSNKSAKTRIHSYSGRTAAHSLYSPAQLRLMISSSNRIHSLKKVLLDELAHVFFTHIFTHSPTYIPLPVPSPSHQSPFSQATPRIRWTNLLPFVLYRVFIANGWDGQVHYITYLTFMGLGWRLGNLPIYRVYAHLFTIANLLKLRPPTQTVRISFCQCIRESPVLEGRNLCLENSQIYKKVVNLLK